jgi:hypothetical protein
MEQSGVHHDACLRHGAAQCIGRTVALPSPRALVPRVESCEAPFGLDRDPSSRCTVHSSIKGEFGECRFNRGYGTA